MDSGWSRFRALYDYKPQDDNEIEISVGDILIVAKPIPDPNGWLLAQNDQTNRMGDVPGTYLEYLDDIEELEPEPEPELPPPRPPKPKPANGGHNTIKIPCRKPVFCFNCEDFVWGHSKEYYKCQDCELTLHLNCAVNLSQFTCSKKDDTTEEEAYEQLVASFEEWTVENVLSWLAITNHYIYANVFLDYGINGSKLQLLNEESLVHMGIEEKSHQLSLLYAIRELFDGDSPQKQSSSFTGFHRAPKGSLGEHEFKPHNFDKIQWCDICGKCLGGVYQQGLQCFICGICSHPKCVNDGIPVCPGRRVRGSGDDDDGVFGKDLGDQFHPSSQPAPVVVMKCVQAIEQRGLRVDGIYSIVPMSHGKSSLHSALNQNPGQVLMTDQEWCDPLVIAAVLKMYFQELPTCLFTEEKYDEFIHVSQGMDGIDGLLRIIEELPPTNQSVIRYFMSHLFKVSQHQQYNSMTSLGLARVFAHVLMRPCKQDKLKMAINHEVQIKALDILISQGPWSRHQVPNDEPTEPQPPPVPVRPRRPSRSAPRPPSHHAAPAPPSSPGFSPPSNMREQVWYWGETSKEVVQERMKEAPDGTFIVRDSKRNPGEYTLTLRKGGLSKLIRIIYQNGKYGFSEPLTFESVSELIDFYRDRSLAQYNPKLDVKLTHPLPLYERDPVEDSESEDAIIGRLENMHKELETKSNKYEELQKEYESMTETANELQMLKDAHCSVIAVIEEQMVIHESFQKDAPPQSRAVLRQNYDLLKHRLNDARCELSESERELSNTSEKSRQTDQLINTLRAQIIELTTQKQNCMDILMNDKGYTQDEVKEIVNEGIRQGCIYQVPDIDLSEENWWFGSIDRNQAGFLLKDCPDGTFLIRDSIHHPGTYSVTLSFDFIPRHIHIIQGANGCYGFNEDYAIYRTIKDLVQHYHNNTLQKHNRHLATKLVYPLRFFKKNV